MVINPNLQSAASTSGLAGAAGAQNKTTSLPNTNQVAEDAIEVTRASRAGTDGIDREGFSISDEKIAQEAAEFARHHILANPMATMSVQANSSPQAVLELLQGVLAE